LVYVNFTKLFLHLSDLGLHESFEVVFVLLAVFAVAFIHQVFLVLHYRHHAQLPCYAHCCLVILYLLYQIFALDLGVSRLRLSQVLRCLYRVHFGNLSHEELLSLSQVLLNFLLLFFLRQHFIELLTLQFLELIKNRFEHVRLFNRESLFAHQCSGLGPT